MRGGFDSRRPHQNPFQMNKMKSLRFLLALAFASTLAVVVAQAGDVKGTCNDKAPKCCKCGTDKDGKICGKNKDCCCTGKKAECVKDAKEDKGATDSVTPKQ